MEDKKHIEDEYSEFEDFLCKRNEKIDNLAYELLCELAGKKLEWNMQQIAEVWQAAEVVLKEASIPYCHPYWLSNDATDEVPCTIDPSCNNPDCKGKNCVE